MSAANLRRRVEALEEMAASRAGPAPTFFMTDPERDPEEFIDQLVADGRLAHRDRSHVRLVRWRTAAEGKAAAAAEAAQ